MPLPLLIAAALLGPGSENLITNGDFSKGNTGFKSALPFSEVAENCLWPASYTIAPSFNKPQLHVLAAGDAYAAPTKRTGKEQVFFANAGGTDNLMVWSSTVECKPNTQYLISFNVISLSGSVVDPDTGRQKPTMDWVPDFEISVNGQSGPAYQAGCGKWNKVRMLWPSGKATSATVKLIRTRIAHGGGVIGIANIEMVPFVAAADN